ncbi:dermonecrotic toxin domain-containing protein [Pseudomonas sp. NPDC090755]|uniref:dermonecrotic toxin domain-containing protein n=1 Tax=Pseudomonas sp. NPDC090755 TaxID=3364481 RepID=UPI00383B7809
MSTCAVSNLSEHLNCLARHVLVQLPELHSMAWTAARKILVSLGVDENPDEVYWHRFTNGWNSTLSYNGWEHRGTPEESMTFTELVMRRFRVSDQDSADALDLWGGFYRAGPQAGVFNQTNEVRLLAQKVLPALWAVDFASDYKARLHTFWQQEAGNLKLLIRINVLAAAAIAFTSGQLERRHLHWIMQAFGVQRAMALTLDDLQGQRPSLGEVQVGYLRLDGHDLVHALWFAHPSGVQLLYAPGGTNSFHVFSDRHAVPLWLRRELNTKTSLLLLAQLGLNTAAAPLAQRIAHFEKLAGAQMQQFEGLVSWQPVTADPCDWLVAKTREQMQADADAQLRSNADLRKQLWIGYLGVGLRVLSPMAIAWWPLALTVVLASVAHMGLSIDQAITARDPEERRAALIAAIVAGVDVLLNLGLLLPGAIPSIDELELYQARLEMPAETAAIPSAEGVLAWGEGQYIRLHGLLYRVRYDASVKSWLIVDPGNPFAFSGNFPVQFSDQLRWNLVEAACLRGGGQCLGSLGPVPSVPARYIVNDTSLVRYHVPAGQRGAVGELFSQRNRLMLSGDMYDPDSVLNPVRDDFVALRERLVEDANRYIGSLPRQMPRSPVPRPNPQVSAVLSLQRLYDEAQGVVIGESHQAIASKRFLIKNMKALARSGVDTLYMEHLMSDLHQADLDRLFAQRFMSARLRDHLAELDAGHFANIAGEDTFTNVVWEASRRGVRVIALDCAASYRLDGLDVQGPLRQKVFSYYASGIIQATRSEPGVGKWLAFVGDTHASTYNGVPGLAQLEDVVSVRIVDAGRGQATEMTLDPGEWYQPSTSNPQGIVRADWRLAIKVRERPFEFLDPSLAPPGIRRP